MTIALTAGVNAQSETVGSAAGAARVEYAVKLAEFYCKLPAVQKSQISSAATAPMKVLYCINNVVERMLSALIAEEAIAAKPIPVPIKK